MNRPSYRALPLNLRLAFALSLTAAIPSLSPADDQVGGSRAAGMAGAGLALPLDIGNNHRLNPAMLGYAQARLSFQYPEFGYHLDGITLSDLQNKFGNLGQGGVDSNKLISIAQTLGDGQKTIGVDASLGIEFGGFSLDGDGSANITTVPTQALVADTKAGSLTNLNDQLDAYGLTDYEVGASYGHLIPTTTGHLSIGATLKSVTAYYAHQYVNGSTITTGSGSTIAAPEMGGADYLKQSGVGADLGLLYDSGKNSNVYYGMTITNFIEPNISFTHFVPVTDPNSGATTETQSNNIDPFRRTFNLGVGGVVNGKILLAADYYDIFNQNDNGQLRLGAEYAFGHGFALRGGYNTTTGFTVGFSVLGINFAYASNSELSAALGVKFN